MKSFRESGRKNLNEQRRNAMMAIGALERAQMKKVELLREFDLSSLAHGALNATGSLGKSVGKYASDFIGLLPDGAQQSVKQAIIEMVFEKLQSAGFPITHDSIVGGIIKNVIENMEWTALSKYFYDKGSCSNIVDTILKGLQEGLQEHLLNNMVASLTGIPGEKLSGIIGSPIREAFNQIIINMTKTIREPLVDFLCNGQDIERLTARIKSSVGQMGGQQNVSKEDQKKIPTIGQVINL